MAVILTRIQHDTLVDLLDQIIPNQDGMPGAGEISTTYIESDVLVSQRTAHTIVNILEATEAVANTHHSKPFSNLVDSAKKSSLQMVADQDPELFAAFVHLVYSGYYTNSAVSNLLGPTARKPQPEGFPVSPFDPSIVENVRNLGPRYRET